MNLFLRLLLGFVLGVVVMGTVLHYLKIPYDRYFPPPLLYVNATTRADGVATGEETIPYVNHWWAGTDDEYYLDYAFQPVLNVTKPNGHSMVTYEPYTSGKVRISSVDYFKWGEKLKAQGKAPVEVCYDPKNPNISLIQGTMGVYNRSAGFFGVWILYMAGLGVLAVIFQELFKRWIPSE